MDFVVLGDEVLRQIFGEVLAHLGDAVAAVDVLGAHCVAVMSVMPYRAPTPLAASNASGFGLANARFQEALPVGVIACHAFGFLQHDLADFTGSAGASISDF